MIEISDLPGNLLGRFEGREHGSSVSFFIGTFDAGTGPGLHLHPVGGEGFRLISITPADHMQQQNLEG
jgi:hypothetical protein